MAEITVFYEGPIVTRAEAKAAGLKRFFTGTPCKRGHVDRRYISGGCVTCALGRANAQYARDPEKVKNAARRWVNANPERRREISRAATRKWRSANMTIEDQQEALRLWRIASPDKHRVNTARGNARRRGAGVGRFSSDDLRALVKKQKGRCPLCGKKLGKEFHLDHITPIALGGQHDKRNLQAVHPECNIRKAAKDPIDFARENGRLL